MKSKTIQKISAIAFAVIAILHLTRSILRWPAEIANLEIPFWASILAVFIAGYLAYANWK